MQNWPNNWLPKVSDEMLTSKFQKPESTYLAVGISTNPESCVNNGFLHIDEFHLNKGMKGVPYVMTSSENRLILFKFHPGGVVSMLTL